MVGHQRMNDNEIKKEEEPLQSVCTALSFVQIIKDLQNTVKNHSY
jgi:hypothetical protein